MADLFIDAERSAILERLDRLTADATAAWGSFDAAHMLTHCIDTFRVTYGEREVTIKRGFMATGFGRWLMLKFKLPKNIGTLPQFLETEPGDFAADKERLAAYIARFADGPDQQWGPSPVFGNMSPKQWSHLQGVHLDHHLRQFGV